LIDNLENCHPQLRALVQSTFGGTVINEIKSLEAEYPYQSQREEPFYCLSLDIKNKKSLKEALDFYVKPEVLEGENKYQCDKYQTLVDAQRSNFIKNMKDTVVINLKRFEFDYNQMMHVKINDHLEFPE
jgi:ubiquitin C-terminal hydrolase